MSDNKRNVRNKQQSLEVLLIRDPLKEVRETLNVMQMHAPLKEFREAMKTIQMHDPLKELQEAMKTMQMHNPLKELQEAMKTMQMHNPLKELQESMKIMQMHNPLKELREAMKAVRVFGEFVSDNSQSPEVYGESGIEINPDGTLIIDSKLVTQERVQEIVQSVISKAFDDSSNVFEQNINKLIQEIRALKNPVFQNVIAWLIYPLIVGFLLSVINPVTDYYIKQRLSKNERSLVVEEVSKTLNETFTDKSSLISFRIVSVSALNVRKSSSSKSDIITTLYLGDVVEIIKKDQKWFLISWRDTENDTSIQGWAYSHYLKAIK